MNKIDMSFQARRKYYRLLNEYYRACMRGIVDDNDKKLMLIEVKKAEKAYNELRGYDD